MNNKTILASGKLTGLKDKPVQTQSSSKELKLLDGNRTYVDYRKQ